jgi:IS5 family transposase
MHNYLAGRAGDAANAILAAIGYNFRLLLAWLAVLWCAIPSIIRATNNAENIENHA